MTFFGQMDEEVGKQVNVTIDKKNEVKLWQMKAHFFTIVFQVIFWTPHVI